MTDQDLRDLLERMAGEEPLPFFDAEPLTRRARRRATRTIVVGAVGVAAALALVFGGASQLLDGSPNRLATDPTPPPSGPILRSAGEILWLGSRGDLLAVDPATGDERVLAEEIGDLDDARWSADGRWAAFVVFAGGSSGPRSLWVVDAGLEPRKVIDLPLGSDRGSWEWSSTGALLAVRWNSMLRIVDPATGEVTDLASAVGIDSTFAWSPDDARIVFGVATPAVRSVDVGTDEASPLVELPWYLEDVDAFSWSPDGSRLAVLAGLAQGANEAQLLVMDADGSDIRIVAEGEFTRALTPDWSPDASRIVFATQRRDDVHDVRIWVAPADGSTTSLVASTVNCDGSYSYELWGEPAWSPDGSQIAFSWEPNCAHVVSADGSSDVEPIDDLTYASWSGGSFCSDCLSWPTDDPLRYTGPGEI